MGCWVEGLQVSGREAGVIGRLRLVVRGMYVKKRRRMTRGGRFILMVGLGGRQ